MGLFKVQGIDGRHTDEVGVLEGDADVDIGAGIPEAARDDVHVLAAALRDADDAEQAEAGDVEVLDPGLDECSEALAQLSTGGRLVDAPLQVRLQHAVDNISHLIHGEVAIGLQLVRVGLVDVNLRGTPIRARCV